MRKVLWKDERAKLGIFIALIIIIQGILFLGVTKIFLNQMNDKYIQQNAKILGVIEQSDSSMAQKVIPVMVGKSEGDYSLGKTILNEYSYNNNLNYKYNPIIGDIGENKLTIIIIILIAIIGVYGALVILKPLFKDIKYLTLRADEIVENKESKTMNRQGVSKAGSLDKLFYKFNVMEDRINNSIVLLQEEKVNLKNIINDISHQLKTPVMALSMYNDILTDHREMESEDMDTFIYSSKEQLDRMEWLVLTLLKYARLESNVVKYNKEMISLNNTIEEVINPLKIKAEEKKQSLQFKGKEDVQYYHDRNWLGEALSNIIKNAIEHTDIRGEIEVTLDETEVYTLISIKDNGEGIEKSEIKKIFKRFYKGESSTNPTSIGIGLCLSKTIVKNHNGDITVESEVGKGTTFYIKLLKTI